MIDFIFTLIEARDTNFFFYTPPNRTSYTSTICVHNKGGC